MGASYWARWACNGQVGDLPDLVLPHVLAEGYDLLATDDRRQAFDRGGVMKKLAWSLNGGRWDAAPIDLTITYSCSPTQTVANFYWRLAVRPFPTTPAEQAAFEAHLQGQMNRVIDRLNEQLGRVAVDQDQEAALEGAALQACWESSSQALTDLCFAPFAPEGAGGLAQAVSTVSTVAERIRVGHGRSQIDGTPCCELCHRPAAPVVGTNGRYYCLICRHHLPYRPAAL